MNEGDTVVMQTCGWGLLLLGIAGAIYGLSLNTVMPDSPASDDFFALSEYRSAVDSVATNIRLRSVMLWASEFLISGGFLVILAELIIRKLRPRSAE